MNNSWLNRDIENDMNIYSREEFEQAFFNPNIEKYVLRLYIAGTTPKSLRALEKIATICKEYLHERYELEVIDIYKQPQRLEEDQIIAIPTLIKKLPLPLQKFIGDLANTEKLLIALDISPYKSN